MSQNSLVAGLLLFLGPSLRAQSLDLPPRQPTAPRGTAFAHSIAALPLSEREEKILAEVKAGNVPSFLRTLVPVSVSTSSVKATYFVAPDYLAIGSDDDFFVTPLTPLTAQAIADRLDCVLPTAKMVDDIYAHATVKLKPAPIPPSPAMTTVAVFLRHNEMVRAERGDRPLGALVAGHKKDVVIANKVFMTPGKVAIYGWHKSRGQTDPAALYGSFGFMGRLQPRNPACESPDDRGRRGEDDRGCSRRPRERGSPEQRRRDAQNPL